jgi:hypothetical protein
MKYMDDMQQSLPVINTDGYYLVDGDVVDSLSGSLLEEKQSVDAVQYYMRRNFIYSEVAS